MDDQIIDHLVGLGARLRRARQDAGLNQKDFGAIGGVGLTTQQQYESGKTPPNAEYLYRLHRYGIDVAELMIGETLGPPAELIDRMPLTFASGNLKGWCQ
ncbi:helix-turn-helix transcriptional regulator [Sphingomonas paucimobilis]|uniref:helix-turn-helix domain-containing protein n=1 Tax=Sphingomonas paucimobilis TaxID=13689 RepID=UPI001963DDAA|nr:helix-turn-helix transcriptional regulator [Sphingomonas paucimobilis]QRY97423.1 helix-turn-helix transcriptional regulator [Sphingomonas paucimobilis]